ncbi:MAG: hypothetical protein ACPGGK_05290 [Pikeienuella sp.]
MYKFILAALLTFTTLPAFSAALAAAGFIEDAGLKDALIYALKTNPALRGGAVNADRLAAAIESTGRAGSDGGNTGGDGQ